MKFGKMKKMLIITLLVMVGVFSQGCSKGGNDNEVVNEQDEYYEDEEDQDEEDQDEDYEEDQDEDQGDTQRVGSSEHGFITLPSDWVSLKELGESELETQYTNESRTSSITLFANRNPVGDPEETARVTYAAIEEQGDAELEAANGEILGYEMIQVLVNYTEEDKQGLFWFFEAEEGCVHSIAMESPAGDIAELREIVESSFSLEE